ncbi:type II secretion system F family protein [Nesterenkonia alkaliphila]|uniref:Type II secretion system protein n=1 Tax=Nesterenkonia alkaliphila TaxID=1463631 RepID=A0A7K1UIZ0_9MICC|nr:type II secretion system F family protein [Nesterenkonia alkaliphila]MVT26021.1 type II secretion system protein [Nesterenkonia alkaliphila]GFZ86141.1 type II secretion system protein F [Nesterenkonia alkaliphila]
MSNLWVTSAGLAAAAAALLLVPRLPAERVAESRPWDRALRGWLRRRSKDPGSAVDAAALLDLTAALLRAGVGIEAGLARLAHAVPGAQPLAGVHRALAAGASWEQAVDAVAEDPELRSFCDHLSFAYATGAPSARMLQAAAARARAERRHEAEAAAERLGVKMMLPLGACFLPAFILLGVVPVVVSMLPDALGI